MSQLQREALQAAADKEKQMREVRECQLQAAIDSLQVSLQSDTQQDVSSWRTEHMTHVISLI